MSVQECRKVGPAIQVLLTMLCIGSAKEDRHMRVHCRICVMWMWTEHSAENVVWQRSSWSPMQFLLIRHLLDVMHCEKNLCENIVKTLLAMKDSPRSRQDAHNLGIREELWLQETARPNADYYMPHAPYVLSPSERKEFVGIISNIRTPTNYVGAIHKRLMDGKLQYMKTHDYHVFMQQVWCCTWMCLNIWMELLWTVRALYEFNDRSCRICICRGNCIFAV